MYSLSQYNHHKYDSKLLVISYFQCLKRPNNKLSDAKINRACENIRTKLRPKNNMTIPQTFTIFFLLPNTAITRVKNVQNTHI